MINRRTFLNFIPFSGCLAFMGLRKEYGEVQPLLREPPENGDWDWWRKLVRTPLARSDDPLANSICQAAARRQSLTILYNGGTLPGEGRRISPLGVFTVEGYSGTYVHAFCHSRNAARTFRVERIISLV